MEHPEDPRNAVKGRALHASRSTVARVEGLASFTHLQQQKRAVTLLLVGALSGFCGFLVSTLCGYHAYKFGPTQTNYMGEPFASGINYKPQTVSEMVHDPRSPEGKAFFAFCLMGAICILVSWYPWELRNVYTGDDRLVCGVCGPTWANFRHFLPPCGMILVACIPVTPPVNREFGDQVVIMFHTLGAVLMIGGYCISEIYCLTCGLSAGELVFKPGEWCLRALTVAIALLCGVTFQACGAMANKSLAWPCADVWRVPSLKEIARLEADPLTKELAIQASEALRLNQKLLWDTASGTCLLVKGGEFWFEVAAGVFMILNMLVIWYCCPERHIDLDEQLPKLSKAELRNQGYSHGYVNFGYGEDLETESTDGSEE